MSEQGTKTRPFSTEELRELRELAALPDAEIDTVDIPAAPGEAWVDARRGDLYRPVKQSVTIRLDADVVAWFKAATGGRGYQSAINRALRSYVTSRTKPTR